MRTVYGLSSDRHYVMRAVSATETSQSAEQPSQTNAEILRRWARNITPWVVLAVGMWWIGSSIESGLLPRGPAPALNVELRSGEAFDLAAQEGKVVVLNFWAAWCPPCRAEAPALSRVAAYMEEHDARLIGLAVDPISLPRATRLGMRYEHALVSQDDADRFRVTTLPSTFVIDASGEITRTFVGEVSESDLREAVDDALGR